MFRYLILIFIVPIFVYCEFTPNQIFYGGMVIECTKGCGEPDEDPDLESIDYILNKTIHSIFKNAAALNESLEPRYVKAWEHYDMLSYLAWDWKSSGGILDEDEIPRRAFDIFDYNDFLKIKLALRDDLILDILRNPSYLTERSAL